MTSDVSRNLMDFPPPSWRKRSVDKRKTCDVRNYAVISGFFSKYVVTDGRSSGRAHEIQPLLDQRHLHIGSVEMPAVAADRLN